MKLIESLNIIYQIAEDCLADTVKLRLERSSRGKLWENFSD